MLLPKHSVKWCCSPSTPKTSRTILHRIVWLLKTISTLTQVALFSKQTAASVRLPCTVVQYQWQFAAASTATAATATDTGKHWKSCRCTDRFGNKQTVWFMERAVTADVTWIGCSVFLRYVAQSDYGAVTGFYESCYELICFIQTLSRLTFWITKLFDS